MTSESGEEIGAPGDKGGAPKLVRFKDEDIGGTFKLLVVNIPLALVKLKGGGGGVIIPLVGGFIRFSFWRLSKKTVGYLSFIRISSSMVW